LPNHIKTVNLEFSYKTDDGVTDVLKGIDLEITSGSFVAVIGHNGSGKSTLAKHFNGVLLPCGGTVYVNGIDTRDDSRIFDIRQRVGMVFQNPDNQIVSSIVEEDVAFALENLGVEPAAMEKRISEALAAVNMTEYRTHATYKLSGGQKQRIAIAGVIAMRPDCIVLDEPTAMLDPVGRREVLRTIRSLNRQFGITVILITHYMNEAAGADRVIVMNDGKIVMDDTAQSVFSQVDELKKLHLDVPQETELLYELAKEGIDIGTATNVDECVTQIMKVLDRK